MESELRIRCQRKILKETTLSLLPSLKREGRNCLFLNFNDLYNLLSKDYILIQRKNIFRILNPVEKTEFLFQKFR